MSMIARMDWNPIKGRLRFEYAIEVSMSRELAHGRLRAWVYNEKPTGTTE